MCRYVYCTQKQPTFYAFQFETITISLFTKSKWFEAILGARQNWMYNVERTLIFHESGKTV